MPAFAPLPLGQRIPDSPHAVSCSLPTLRAVRGYEEKDPAIARAVQTGYPRFVVHPFLQQLAAHIASRHDLADHTLWLASSGRVADRLSAHLGRAQVIRLEHDALPVVAHPARPELAARAKLFLQNTGGFLSSRAAEDALVRAGLLAAAAPEPLFAGDAAGELRRHLTPLFPGAGDGDLFPASCGMSAIDAAFRAVSELQAARGRTIWIQLGWLYLDTIAILKKFTATPGDYIYINDVFDLAALEKLFAEKGDRIAGVFAEVPTNPLIQVPDVAAIAALARHHGATVLLDPTISSAFAIDVFPHSDILVTSLTKYAASEGDLIAGLTVVNPAAADAALLRRSLASKIEPLYARDLARLAAEIGEAPATLAQIQASVPRVAAFLETHPGVKEVFWAHHPASRENYLRIARSPDAVGSMITFTLRGSLERFYDRLRLAKGPSFGMKTTLICPFMYLAHYDLVTTPAGRAELASCDLDPELLRLSIGTEPADEIITALAEALA
ncbi:MAG TPA: PLP-dependent transferase [Opitutus sp.]|nr:PLP-dependent transferase [Opitutus sp.]